MIEIDGITKQNKGHLCAIINTYGTGQHAFADLGTLAYFEEGYIGECLETAYEKNNHEDRRRIVNEIREELGS